MKYEAQCGVTGNVPYLRTETCFGKESYSIVYSVNLKEAKAQHGWTRMRYTRVAIRRARPDDRALVPERDWCGCPDGHIEKSPETA